MTGYAIEVPASGSDLVEMMAPRVTLAPLKLTARAEWFLEKLIAAGAEGVTTASYPGVRISDCLFKLRRAEVDVATEYERHGGEFQGSHGRFILRSKVVRVDGRTPAPLGCELQVAP
jgi:hypothetical protein